MRGNRDSHLVTGSHVLRIFIYGTYAHAHGRVGIGRAALVIRQSLAVVLNSTIASCTWTRCCSVCRPLSSRGAARLNLARAECTVYPLVRRLGAINPFALRMQGPRRSVCNTCSLYRRDPPMRRACHVMQEYHRDEHDARIGKRAASRGAESIDAVHA